MIKGSNNITFEGEALEAIEAIKGTRENLFITGKAGTGKSTLLYKIREIFRNEIVVLAPTGIAAINVGGDTIHSFFRLKPGFELDEAKHMPINPLTKEKYRPLHTILIDEISMVRSDILDAIDIFLKRARDSFEPFGGVRMIFFGDLFQLPPVVSREDEEHFYSLYKTPYFFSADLFQMQDLFTPGFQIKTITLSKVYRQKDSEFIHVLNAIRENRATPKELAFINQRLDRTFQEPPGKEYIHLMGTNAQANRLNSMRLNKIPSPIIKFEADQVGDINNLRPNAPLIEIKIGAQVMFINNDPDKRWVNGTIGTILDVSETIDKDSNENIQIITVKTDNDRRVKVKRHTWEISRYCLKDGKFQRENIGYFTQIPIILAWAITIHKSQGKTFNNVVVDLGYGSFAHGQTYVALSRCRTLEGMVLKSPIRESDVIVDERIKNYTGQ